MGKEIGDFAGGLAQGATGGFQQLMQQQMQQRQFDQQREFALKRDELAHGRSLERDEALSEDRIALLNKRNANAVNLAEIAGQHTTARLEADVDIADKKVLLAEQDIVLREEGLKQKQANADRAYGIAVNSEATSHKRLVEQIRAQKKSEDVREFDKAEAHKIRAQEQLNKLMLSLGIEEAEQQQYHERMDITNRQNLAMAGVAAAAPLQRAKFLAQDPNLTSKDFEKSLLLYGEIRELTAESLKMPERVRGAYLDVNREIDDEANAVYNQIIENGGSKAAAMIGSADVYRSRIGDLRSIVNKKRGLLKKTAADKRTAAANAAEDASIDQELAGIQSGFDEKRRVAALPENVENDRRNALHRKELFGRLSNPPQSTIGGRR